MRGHRAAPRDPAVREAGTEIVGREEELARIAEFVGRADGPDALVVQGEAGIGKTTLWRAGIDELEAAGYRVLRTTPAASEASLPLSALTDLLEPAYAEIRLDLPPPQRRALDTALALAEPEDPGSFGERLLHAATKSALGRLAQLAPIALAADDLQWVDAESAAVLSYALRRFEGERVRCLFALRLGAPSAFDLTELGGLPVERLSIGPLSLGATQRLLLNELGVTYARTVIRRLVETSGGNPFYALELALGLERVGAVRPDDRLVLSEKLDTLISARLSGVSEIGQQLLAVLCLLPSAGVDLLDAVGALGGLDEVVAAGLVRLDGQTVRFTHPLLAAGAHARLGPEERRRVHAALADVLDDPVERACHLARASIAPSADAAVELARAAEIAIVRGLPPTGAELAEEAVRLTPQADVQASLDRRALAARAYARAGSFERARQFLDGLLPELQPGDERADALRLRAQVTGDISHQRDLLHQALDDTDDPSISSEANALLVRNYLYTGELREALAAARAGDAQARLTGDRRRIVGATTTLGLMQIWGTGAPDPDVYERARAFAAEDADLPSDTYSNPHTLIGARALYRYELEEARGSYTTGASWAEAAGEVDSLETFWWGLAQLEVRAGRYASAHEYAGKMRESGETFDRRPLSIRWLEGLLAVYDGRIDDARTALDETLAVAGRSQNWFFDAYGRAAKAFLELSVDAPGRALEALAGVLDTRFVLEGDPGQTGILPLAAEAMILTGELDHAAAVVDGLEQRGRELDHLWCRAVAARARGLLLAEQGELEAALRTLDESLELHERVPAPFELARTLLVLGSIRRRAKQRRAAREALEEAVSVFEEVGTPLWLEKARAELARIGGRAPSRGELTPNEMRIATLVGEGKTNKEVAAALFVTDRTVESALTQIYRKLDVRSRTELARRLEQA